MKKIFYLLGIALLSVCFANCSGKNNPTDPTDPTDPSTAVDKQLDSVVRYDNGNKVVKYIYSYEASKTNIYGAEWSNGTNNWGEQKLYWTLSYDSKGNMIDSTEWLGPDFTLNEEYKYTYDANSKLIKKEYWPKGTELQYTWTYSYNAEGKLAEFHDGDYSTTYYFYDASGNLIKDSVAYPTHWNTHKYTYENNNENGITITKTFDSSDDGSSSSSDPWYYVYSNGKLIRIVYDNDIKYQYTYDADGYLDTKTDYTWSGYPKYVYHYHKK